MSDRMRVYYAFQLRANHTQSYLNGHVDVYTQNNKLELITAPWFVFAAGCAMCLPPCHDTIILCASLLTFHKALASGACCVTHAASCQHQHANAAATATRSMATTTTKPLCGSLYVDIKMNIRVTQRGTTVAGIMHACPRQ